MPCPTIFFKSGISKTTQKYNICQWYTQITTNLDFRVLKERGRAGGPPPNFMYESASAGIISTSSELNCIKGFSRVSKCLKCTDLLN